jgi:hypothetical protein
MNAIVVTYIYGVDDKVFGRCGVVESPSDQIGSMDTRDGTIWDVHQSRFETVEEWTEGAIPQHLAIQLAEEHANPEGLPIFVQGLFTTRQIK